MTKIFLAVSASLILLSCDSAQRIVVDNSQEKIDFSDVLPGDWSQLCIIEPYTDNARAGELLGFDIDIRSKSKIGLDDSITLLLTTRAPNTVISYTEIGRCNVDLAAVANRCYQRQITTFLLVKDLRGRVSAQRIN